MIVNYINKFFIDLGLRIWRVIWYSDLEFTRWFIAWMAMLGAIIFFFPGDSFQRNTFLYLQMFFSEEVWGGLLLFNALISLYALLYREKVNWLIFILDAILSCVLWNTIAIALFLAQHPTTSYCAAVTSWWILIRYPWQFTFIKIKSKKNNDTRTFNI